MATLVVQPPTKFDVELARWSLRELSLYLRRRWGWKVSRSSLSRFLRQAWLAAHPRVSFVFTPFHGSWLNQVEIWFSILNAKCLKGRAFSSVRALAAAIRRFADRWNREMSHAFEWTYTGKVLHA